MPKNHSDDALYLELEDNDAAIRAFVDEHNALTEQHLFDDRFAEDVKLAQDIIENPNSINGITRRGDWVYTFKRTAEHPLGLWMRRSAHARPVTPEGWETVFDVGAFCEQTGENWQWAGACTAGFNADKVLLVLAHNGSDQLRHIEFDCQTLSIVEGGFDLPPARGSVDWYDDNTLIAGTTHGPESATDSGWPRHIRRVKRGQQVEDAEIMFSAEMKDLAAWPHVLYDPDVPPLVCYARSLAIGKSQATLAGFGPDGKDLLLKSPTDCDVWNNRTHFAFIVNEDGGAPGALMLGTINDMRTRELFRPGPRAAVDSASIGFLRDWLFWVTEENLERQLFALDLRVPDAEPVAIDLPEAAENFSVHLHDQIPVPGKETLQLHMSGFLTSPRIYLFDLSKGPHNITWDLLWSEPEAFDATGLKVEILEAISDDGTRVPYRLVGPPDDQRTKGELPVLMYGYGGFGSSVAPYYNKILGRLWLEQGGAYVLAHIRGGAEFGPQWHTQAKGEGRTRAFEDFASIARDLSNRQISSPAKTGCQGASNGGLLCGVMATRYPKLFGAIWANVGVYDMLRFNKFEAGPAWIDEYGDPEDETARKWLTAYSPMHQVKPVSEENKMPPLLLASNAFDDRVDPSHTRRFAARSIALGHTPNFYEHSKGGHGGGGGSVEAARALALGFVFLKRHLGIC